MNDEQRNEAFSDALRDAFAKGRLVDAPYIRGVDVEKYVKALIDQLKLDRELENVLRDLESLS